MGKPARQGRGRAYVSNSAVVGRMWLHHAAGSTYLQEEPCAGRSNLQERVVLAFLPSTWHAVLSSYMHAGVAVTVRVSELGLRAFRMYQAVDGLASGLNPAWSMENWESLPFGLRQRPAIWHVRHRSGGWVVPVPRTVSQGSWAHNDG